ncbi:MAG TPA: hypothetical protein VGE97_02670 [Nitrososphaera sp.]|jgi:hypothetical protein
MIPEITLSKNINLPQPQAQPQPQPPKSEPFWQDSLKHTWESDNTRPWGKPYSKSERFRYFWDEQANFVERRT